MDPWFKKEDNVLKFPVKKQRVIQLPNVASYPNFLDGVKDLQTKLADELISQESYNKLYTDLIHRFMRKEDRETPWFLREYDDLSAEKKNIIARISQLKAENETDADLLDRIYKLLNSETIKPNIANAFRGPLEDDNFGNVDDIVKELTKIVFAIESDYKKISLFLTKLEKQKGAINIGKLTSVGVTTFAEIFDNDDVAIKAFYALKRFGVGQKQKGPGEYALAVLSNKIKILQAGGDVSIDGKLVEVKASIGSSGGRLGMGGPTNAQGRKYWEGVSPSIVQHFAGGQKTLGLSTFLSAMNNDYPLSDPAKRTQRQTILNNWFTKVFDNGGDIANAFMQEDLASVQSAYVRANYESYKAKDNFQGLLVLSYGAGKTAYAESPDDLINLFKAGHLASPSISVVPSNSSPREVFTQISLTKAKV